MTNKNDKTPNNTISRVLDKRELDNLAVELSERWQKGENSVRELTRRYNLAILREALLSAGAFPVDGEIEALYDELNRHNDGASPQARVRLEEAGVEIAELQSDMVSHQTMYRYLRDVCGIKKPQTTPSLEDAVSSVEESVQKLSGRLRAVVIQNLERLNKRDSFYIADPDVIIDIRISCSSCGDSKQLHQMLRTDGCACGQDRN